MSDSGAIPPPSSRHVLSSVTPTPPGHHVCNMVQNTFDMFYSVSKTRHIQWSTLYVMDYMSPESGLQSQGIKNEKQVSMIRKDVRAFLCNEDTINCFEHVVYGIHFFYINAPRFSASLNLAPRNATGLCCCSERGLSLPAHIAKALQPNIIQKRR